MRKMFRKADYALLAVLIVIGIAVSAALSFGKTSGGKVVIKVAGKPYGVYSLSEDKTISVDQGDGHSNTVVIEGGTVRVTEATCHNQVCVRHEAISSTGESIICLPNQVIVAIEGEEGEFDAISS